MIAKKRKVANKDVTEKRDQPVLDSDNLQTNRIKKKAFKQRQKDERRRGNLLNHNFFNFFEVLIVFEVFHSMVDSSILYKLF